MKSDILKLFSSNDRLEALSDVKVVELSGDNFAGAIAGAMLSELGAEVVRIELDDSAKEITPYGVKVDGVGIPYLIENRYKEILKVEEINDEVRDTMAESDVVIDALQPGFLDSAGAGYRHLSVRNPAIIYVAVSPFGHFTEKAKENANIPDSDLTAQAYNGYPSLIGNPYLTDKFSYPLRAGMWAAWTMAGVNAAIGALLALIERSKSGKGQFVDIATNDALAIVNIFPYVVAYLFGKSRTRYGTVDYIAYPFGYYRVKDGYVALATPTDADFRALLKIIGRWDLEPDWKFMLDRISDDLERIKVLDEELNKELRKHTVNELISKARKVRRRYLGRFLGTPIIVKLTPLKEVIESEHWRVRKSLLTFEVDGKNVVIPNTAFKVLRKRESGGK
ncbi:MULTISPECIES: CaiB/BaiF CoA-transferase family protein [unclassified Archaeoglobus]|uniref:CaiB/BaiF CoA-transferase family protein n=1 Tax=unclassified Archaeoglobus TaxID=2643606 RepID=UPI0025C66261|nr:MULTISPECIES: CaiB/BaiF CoA-transferase family protein [unclassified Archaeoglobus]